jgi:CDP-paratose 2-epimerase
VEEIIDCRYARKDKVSKSVLKSVYLGNTIDFESMSVALITGSAGLIGSETSRWFHDKGFDVVGIDNDMRAWFFGEQASTGPTRERLQSNLERYQHHSIDIRNTDAVGKLFAKFGKDIKIIVHTAAQPSHDWAARDPFADFSVNANGTLNMLEATRRHAPEAVFIFTSTNKVYGDTPNRLPLIEQVKRWEIDSKHPFLIGIDESMSIDQSKHSLFGASKVAADVLVQEYGRYFGMRTACFRGGCLTGPGHAGTELHGFLAYLMKCTVKGMPYRVFGYKGKQVRDNIHSHDLVSAFWEFFNAPRSGEVYNMGGSRHSNCSMLEAIDICEELSGKKLQWQYEEDNRIGDHIWYVSDVRRFQSHYPNWKYRYGLRELMKEIHDACAG